MRDAYLLDLTRRFVGGMVDYPDYTAMVHSLWAGRDTSDLMNMALHGCWDVQAEVELGYDQAASIERVREWFRSEGVGSISITASVPIQTGHETSGNPCAVAIWGSDDG
jgi:hypothetical protein